MAAHVKKITFFIGEEPPVKLKTGYCTSSSVSTIYDDALRISNACSQRFFDRDAGDDMHEILESLRSKIDLCQLDLNKRKPNSEKNYLTERVRAWKQKIEHMESAIKKEKSSVRYVAIDATDLQRKDESKTRE